MKLFTWGYGNRSQADLAVVVELNRISVIIDVRRWAGSKHRPEWSKSDLTEGPLGRLYEHYPALGNKSDAVSRWQPPKPAEAEAAIYALGKRIDDGERLLLMCAEADHEKCHRGVIAERLQQATGAQIRHIMTTRALTEDEAQEVLF